MAIYQHLYSAACKIRGDRYDTGLRVDGRIIWAQPPDQYRSNTEFDLGQHGGISLVVTEGVPRATVKTREPRDWYTLPESLATQLAELQEEVDTHLKATPEWEKFVEQCREDVEFQIAEAAAFRNFGPSDGPRIVGD